VIAWQGYTSATTGYGFDLHDGADLNGAIRLLAPGTEAYIYDSSHVLQQRLSLADAQASILSGSTLVFDSTGAFYGTRRAYGQTFQSSYAGPWPTYTTDTAANWTPAAGTNLNLGSVQDGTLPINGNISYISIHSAR
jgi:hypothetical protein